MTQLAIKETAYGTPDQIGEHIRFALDLKLPELVPALCSHDGHFVIVGSGPSLLGMVEQIREEKAKGRPICAIKGAHDFLIEHGIEPTFWLSLDPRPRVEHISKETQDTIYLVASRCHPSIFEKLGRERVVLWHSLSPAPEVDLLKVPGVRRSLIGGGTTSGLRAMSVAFVMGFRNFILYGMDSCLADDGLTKRFNGDKAGAIVPIWLDKEKKGRRFLANMAMAKQAEEFEENYKFMPGISVDAKGDGLIAAIIARRKELGLRA